MIVITIQRVTRTEWEETEHQVMKRTPTEINNPDPGSYRDKKLYIEEFENVPVKKRSDVEVTLLKQVIEKDDALDLPAVIAAINKMPLKAS